MDLLILNGTDGFPLYTDTLAEAQRGWNIFNGLTGLAGEGLTIIKGCEQTGSNVGAGFVSINGELLPFAGGALGNNVIIKETITSREFKDKSTKPVFAQRVAMFGTSTPEQTYPWANFKRLKNLATITEEISGKALQTDMDAVEESLSTIKSELSDLKTALTNHIENMFNPHETTLEQLGIVKKGSIYLGDIQGKTVGWSWSSGEFTCTLVSRNTGTSTGGDDLYRINFAEIGTTDYKVLGSLKAVGSNFIAQNDVIFSVMNLSDASFDLSVRETSQDIQNLYFDFIIIK